MTEGRSDRVEALFYEAADLSPPEQRALLDAACPDDPSLRAAVERLLADDARLRAADGATPFLNSPLVRPSTPTNDVPEAAAGPALPPRIGRYRILRLLGEGGMGAVYEAEQDNPRRPVALKVIRPGLVSPALLERFAREAQILGRLHHPGVAQIYEAGAAEDGRPFFALEFIRGLPLDEYARRRGLDPAARLDLLARVCDAVQHAHEQGVLHRDLKPSNILVDEDGQPKVLDFGIARGLGDDARTGTGLTGTGELVGTLRYMSPEQVAADPAGLDRRSDVYALGVILFELLAGRPPYPLEQLPLPEAARVIREQEPARLGALDARLRGDVETIVAKALEKDRDRRYRSAAELASDIRRRLRNEPIRARPPSVLYLASRFARRHKALVGATAAFLSLLLGAGAVTAWQAIRLAQAERDQAVQQARRGREVQEALARAAVLREQARSASGDLGKWGEARAEAWRAAALEADGAVGPELAEQVRALLRELDEEEKDRQMVAELEGIRLREAEVKEEEFDTRAAAPLIAEAFRRYGVDVEALSAAEAARRVRASAIREALLTALDHWAWYEESRPRRAKVWAVADEVDDNPWRRRLRAAARRNDAARLEELKELAKDAAALEQPPAVQALLGERLQAVGLAPEAAAFLRQAQRRHPDDFWVNHVLAHVLIADLRPPRPEEALSYFRAALALRPRSPGAQYNVGNALLALGDLDGAAACYLRALELNPQYASANANLGLVLWKQKDKDLPGAAARLREAVKLNPKDARAHYNLGSVLQDQGDLPGAEASFRRALASVARDAVILNNLGAVFQGQGDLSRAEASFRRALAVDAKDFLIHINLGNLLQRRGDLTGAVACYRRALAIDPKCAEAHCALGLAFLDQGNLREALTEVQTGHDLGSRRKDWSLPSGKWLEHCQRCLELDGRLPAILKGEARPAGAAECIALGELCRYKRLYAPSVRFYTEAFKADARWADSLQVGNRYRAACSAALAGCGQGEETARPGEAGRAELRRQALEWLRADLGLWSRHGAEGAPQNRAQVQAALRSWQTDPDLAGVREPDLLAALTFPERAEWRQLWADVTATVAKARETK
jgi:tetratricopeptide (TPR) repeat protein/predicted Ser/Thr protein kinase